MKKIFLGLVICLVMACFTGCEYTESASTEDKASTIEVGNRLSKNQPTPTDIDYSLERYNLIKRTYWVNG